LAYTANRGYGWTTVPNGGSRDRGNVNANRLLDTFVYNSAPATWQYTLPNGNYLVTLSCGDASYKQGPQLVTVQGNVVVNDVTTQVNQFATVTNYPVTVNNGQLTITIGGSSGNTMLNYVTIMAGAQ
jgi:hypothetical protein